MRAEFVQAVLAKAEREPELLFLSGDLGFMALEPLATKLGARFINAGVAEQNMVAMAAALASRGFRPIVYSIASFAVLRPLEQIRNTVCLHDLPVTIVGNGGGYGYGIMGATHHALEDVAVMRTMPNMRVLLPVTSADVGAALDEAFAHPGPAYIRLNLAANVDFLGEESVQPRSLQPFRQVRSGEDAVIVCLGPLVGEALKALAETGGVSLSVWVLSRFPFGDCPAQLLEEVRTTRRCLVIEEHVAAGGAGEALAAALLSKLDVGIRFRRLFAQGYPTGRYGSQRWHLAESSLAGEGLVRAIRELCE